MKASSIPITENKAYIAGIDGLKALAIIGVTLFHIFPNAVPGGYLGVSLFLLLTGYLLAYTTMKEYYQGRFRLGHYFLKRLLRIYPPLIVVILTTIGVYSLVLPNSVRAIRPEVLSILGGYNNWWQIAQNADYFTRLINASPFTHLWFMGIEIQYLALWPIVLGLCVLVHKISSFWGPLVLLGGLGILSASLMPLFYVPGQDVTRLYYGTDMRVYAMLFGAMLGLVKAYRQAFVPLANQGEAERTKLKSSLAFTGLFVWLLVLALLGYALLDGQSPFLYQGGMIFFTLVFCGMVWLVQEGGFVSILEKRPIRWLGQHSYGIFLWQYPVLYLFQQWGWHENLPLANYFDVLPHVNAYAVSSVYFMLSILVILLLTIWTDSFVSVLEAWTRQQRFSQYPRKCILFLVSLCGVFYMILGCQAIYQSESVKAANLDELKSRLAANAAELQAENEKALAEQAKREEHAKQGLQGVGCIGDSVMLGSAPSLRKVLPGAFIDAKVSRYVGDGLAIAETMQANQQLGPVVLIGLGTNGPITGQYEEQTKELVAFLGDEREIFWVNVYCPELYWQDPNNAYLEKLAKEHDNITIIDWKGLIAQHPEWLSDDGVHPNDEGVAAYAKLVHDTMEARLQERAKI